LRTREAFLKRPILLVATLLLPIALVYTAVRTIGELERQREVYLRGRVAAVAARLETAPVEAVLAGETDVLDIAVIERGTEEGRRLAPIWEGRELFRTERGEDVFRAYVPFHSEDGLRVARIDIAERAADFLVVHARRNVLAAIVVSLAVAGLALALAWSARRAARLEQRQLELEHLAHIGKMSAALAHEIRNPLGTIKGFAQLLGERGRDSALVEPILSETTRLEHLVRDLLLYGRPPSPSRRAVAWSDIAGRLRAHAESMGSAVLFSAESPDVTFVTDPNLLEQALLNLVRNGIEAAESEVKVRVARNGGVSILVEDDGPGFESEARDRMYEPFFTTKASGTGLGLAITRSLVGALGGHLEVGPRPGGGTVARVELPWNVS
jgi:two-component system sensor histidine kinase HydH